MKRSSISLVITEMQIKNHYTTIKQLKKRREVKKGGGSEESRQFNGQNKEEERRKETHKLTELVVKEAAEQLEYKHCLWECKIVKVLL